jgi:N-acetylglucosaminyldiphosphoundecaprenol N-acetyl-beta-D-mannosaminyltransferase
MPFPRFDVLQIGISAITMPRAIEAIAGWIAAGDRQYVNVCTTDVVLRAHDDPRLADIIRSSGMATPDGMPLVWLGRLKGLDVGRVYGPDLMLALCQHGLMAGWRHYFYGATEEVLRDLTARLTERFPQLQVAGVLAPPFRALTREEEAITVARINTARPDLVWVGIGTPKQDFWMAHFRARLDAPVLIAVGAAFNFHAGQVRQAPRWMMRAGLEWLFRLAMEPRRLWRRYLIGIPRFIWLVALDRMGRTLR